MIDCVRIHIYGLVQLFSILSYLVTERSIQEAGWRLIDEKNRTGGSQSISVSLRLPPHLPFLPLATPHQPSRPTHARPPPDHAPPHPDDDTRIGGGAPW